MSLPVNVEDLIHGKAIEWERLEFKKGWNPEDIVHTVCAFANDLNNWGGGYIIVGVEEENGQPILPPEGVPQSQFDKIQGKVLSLAHQLLPNYFPIIQPYILQGKHILVIWCPAGDNRPYLAPSTQGTKAERHPYIRYGSRSIIAKGDNLKRLQELAARIPFDDRLNGIATVGDFDLGLIQAYLHEVKSDLLEDSRKLSSEDLSRQMYIAKGPDENLRPVNAGVLFFCKNPDQFLSRPWIELVWHKNFSGKDFTEKYFKGPIQDQLRAVLAFIQNNIIQEHVIKNPEKAEATRFYNFPFVALEEALSNAVYHKSYEIGSPIEVQIWPDKIEILSYPGPVPPVNAQILQQQKRIVAREYRNRRIGDFLKELKLTEGRGTGFPAIYRSMDINGSPEPKFETDKDCTYFLTVLPARINNEQEPLANKGSNVALSTIGKAQSKSEGADEGADEGANNETIFYTHDDILGHIINLTFVDGTSNMKTNAKLLLNLMIQEQGKRAPDYAIDTGLSLSTVERYIRKLKRLGFVNFSQQPTNVGGYFITDKLAKQLEK
ncbi:RNA-binding domain-containing protein [Pedobacter sp. AW31-3R]|uniref:RNA-binding domain-containing protein n=1 Tax=Pedobacter sp. AW31-3R TaxID=3445781 RepID=UPI003FA081B0